MFLTLLRGFWGCVKACAPTAISVLLIRPLYITDAGNTFLLVNLALALTTEKMDKFAQKRHMYIGLGIFY